MNCGLNFSTSIAPMDYFEGLPEGCKVEIISKTTPIDAVRSTILSKEFKSIAESDEIWGSFLPPDYQDIIDRSDFCLVYNTKKELFFSLCDSTILLDGGKLSFSLDKHSGKKCFMIAPSDLIILESDYAHSWEWSTCPDSRFFEAAYLRCGERLDICGRIETEMLSPETEYGAYLVFKLDNTFHGLISAKSSIRFVDYESEIDTENQANTVHFSRSQISRDFPKLRGDGWMEVQLAYFNSKKGSDGPIEARLVEATNKYKADSLFKELSFVQNKSNTSSKRRIWDFIFYKC